MTASHAVPTPRRRSRSRSRARGASLVEVVLVLTVSSVILAIAVTGLASLLRLDQTLSGAEQGGSEATLLIATLRRDCHEGARVEFDAASGSIVVQDASGQQIRYTRADAAGTGSWQRSIAGPAGPRTRFRLPVGAKLELAQPTTGVGDLAELTLTAAPPTPNPAEAGAPAATPLRIQIAVGRDAAFTQQAQP
ncbi:MAG: hypothetical protein AAF790_12335 [Planctomycetota bacterium]